MKSADELKARLGGHMKESMGAGRGMASPAPTVVAFHGETEKYRGAARVKDALAIELNRLSPDPGQPRKEFDQAALESLAASLKSRGQLQPIRVRFDASVSQWIIIAGERRYRAAILAGLPTLLCVEARGPLTPDDLLEDQLIENIIRENLRPIEQAVAFKTLIDRRGWSYRQLGEALHLAPASIARALALLDLSETIKDQVESGALAASVAYEVSRIADADDQAEVASRAVAKGMNRAEVVEAVRAKTSRSTKASKGRGAKARKTSTTIRTSVAKITIESRKGVDDDVILAAARELIAIVEGRAVGERDAA